MTAPMPIPVSRLDEWSNSELLQFFSDLREFGVPNEDLLDTWVDAVTLPVN